LISHGNSFRSALTARIEEVSDIYRNLAGWDESLKPRQKVYGFQFYPSQMLHVWNIYLYIYPKNDPYVGKYSSTMEHLGMVLLFAKALAQSFLRHADSRRNNQSWMNQHS